MTSSFGGAGAGQHSEPLCGKYRARGIALQKRESGQKGIAFQRKRSELGVRRRNNN